MSAVVREAHEKQHSGQGFPRLSRSALYQKLRASAILDYICRSRTRFGRESIRDRVRAIPPEERVEAERRTLREEIAALHSQLERLERDFEQIAAARAQGIPYSYELKTDIYKNWK